MKRYKQFILESNFLKQTDLVGYLDLSYYPELVDYFENLDLPKTINNTQNDFLIEGEKVIWDYANKFLTEKINEATFKQETESNFNLGFLQFTREPIEIGTFYFNDFTNSRVNHYMLKNNSGGDFVWGDFQTNRDVNRFVQKCITECERLKLDWNNRYCYLTIDQMWIEAGKSQREFGWHIDGMQGDEVSIKVPADFQFIWADATPTRFCTKAFDIEGLDPSRHNVFNWLAKQTQEKYCYLLEKEKIYLMNAYHVHSATLSDKVQYRRFVRLSFTNTPITSVKMTINPDINYNYPIHKTTGNIPKHLL